MSRARDLAGIFNLNPLSGTTAQRPTTAEVGEIYYNGTTGKTQIYTPTGWQDMASGIPFGNNAARPASPVLGTPYFNGEEKRLELYTSSGWQNIVSETPGVVSVSGNYLESVGSATLEITGTNFTTGAIASVIGTNGVEVNANSTTVNSIVSISAVFSGLSAAYEPYDLKVTNTSNLFGLLPDSLYINQSPVWQTTSGSLGTFTEQVSVSLSATALDSDSTIVYSLAAGSSLPSGVSLNSATGLISGTLPNIATNTTYTFTVNASDGSNAAVPRTFSISSVAWNAEVLIVGGGGAGANGNGNTGGGGAGGLVYASSYALAPASTLLVTVGAGGAQKADGPNQSGNRGSDSYFGSIVAAGGGGGVGWGDDTSTRNGGSAGGGGGELVGGTQTQTSLNSGVTGILQYGNNGGSAGSWSPPYQTGGGGGGAGSVGNNGTGNGTANGGNGLAYSITGASVYYAGGGGGGTEHQINSNTPDSPGGLGGGGTGRGWAATSRGGDGTDGLGGGGGAGSYYGGGLAGGKGGSGVVIIAYPNTLPNITTIPGTLTYTLDTTTRSGYKVYKFTAGSGTVTF